MKVLALTLTVPPLAMPPPTLAAELAVKVLALTVAVAELLMPPPLSMVAELLVKVLPLTRRRTDVVEAATEVGGVASEGSWR